MRCFARFSTISLNQPQMGVFHDFQILQVVLTNGTKSRKGYIYFFISYVATQGQLETPLRGQPNLLDFLHFRQS